TTEPSDHCRSPSRCRRRFSLHRQRYGSSLPVSLRNKKIRMTNGDYWKAKTKK
ncbi:hypothetical protein LINPERPRIM_LOCUS29931, partial [Linum perenne]